MLVPYKMTQLRKLRAVHNHSRIIMFGGPSGFARHYYTGVRQSTDKRSMQHTGCGSPPGVMMADTLSFNAKIGVVDF